MEYTVNKLARMSGVSSRTLRYYDQIGLLSPARVSGNGYRIYGKNEIDLLQQILFYRELGMPLDEIGKILKNPDYDREQALMGHLNALIEKRRQIELLIQNVEKTIRSWKGECEMNDREKFEGFKQNLIVENEAAYGKELRKNYGDDVIEESNDRIKGMNEEQWQRAEELRNEYESLLKKAFAQGDPAGEDAQKACDLHRQWICMFWKEGMYSKKAHRWLADLYAADERFTQYYEKLAAGCTEFFRNAILCYLNPV